MTRADPAAAASAEPLKPASGSRKSAQKRESIVRAAIEVINAKSFALATMTDIAATLNLRDATLYYYFPNKQALVYACHRRSLERFERLLGEADEAGGPGAAKLRRFIENLLIDSHLNGPQLYFGDHSYLEDAQRQAVDDWAKRLRFRLEKFLKDGVADGSILTCETELVVQLLIGMLIWLAKWVPDVKGLTVNRLMNAIGAVAFEGLELR